MTLKYFRYCVRAARRAGFLHSRTGRPNPSRAQRGRSAAAEPLENRQLLAHLALQPATGLLEVSGDFRADSVLISHLSAATIRVSLNADGRADHYDFPASSVSRIAFLGRDGDDAFRNETSIPATAVGGMGDDTLVGGSANDVLQGDQGDDLLLGRGGNDSITGGADNDRLEGGDGKDVLHGGSDADTVLGDSGNDEVYGGEGNDVVEGGDGNDVLRGFDGDDILSGGPGNDEILGMVGQDRLVGGAGNDTLDGGNEKDDLDGGPGDDLLDGADGDDVLAGGDGNDVLRGGLGDDWLVGGLGHDDISGFDGNDTLYGGEGNDLLDGKQGIDILYGEAGSDILNGGSEGDVLVGADGDDSLDGGTGNDILHGDAGSDILFGGVGDNLLFGGDGNDVLNGFDGRDILFGNRGDDKLDGSGGSDILVGHSGKDTLDGGGDDDLLIGGDHIDALIGRSGNDLLIGGASKHDLDVVMLRQIRDLWASPLSYQSRIRSLEDPLFNAYLFAQDTVFDDAVPDDIFGNEGVDWFFLTGALQTYAPPSAGHAHDGSGPRHHPSGMRTNTPPSLEGFDFINSLDKLRDVSSGEEVHTIIPHGSDPSKMSEHLALYELVRYDQVTHTAVASGPWTSPHTWQDGRIPQDGANVLIPVGKIVTVDAELPADIRTVRVDGTLRFDPHKNTEIRVDTMIITAEGAFEMGTLKIPIQPSVTARVLIVGNGPIDRTWDPFGLSRGLIIHGRMTVYGAARTSHASLAVQPWAGSNLLLLSAAPVGWQVGDAIVLAGADGSGGQDEIRRILDINGRIVWIDSLQFDHFAPEKSLGVHVANLSRNAVIQSESTALDRRGHVMFMHTRDVNLNYAGFYHLGRTNKDEVVSDPVVDAQWQLAAGTGTNPRGRYAVHFHRNGVTNDHKPAVVRGSAVVDSPGWGYVNHSSFVEFTDNVAYNVDGAAFVTEAGDEIGAFRNNIAIHSVGSGDDINARELQNDFGHEGNGFWFQGAGVSITGNISAGHTGHAFIIYARGLNQGRLHQQEFHSDNLVDPALAHGRPTIDVRHVPIPEFRDNVGYASAVGLTIRYHLRDAPHDHKSVFENSNFWNNTTGVDLPYTQNVVLRNLRVVRPFNLDGGTGIDSNLVTSNITYENLTVSGYWRGIDLPRSGYSIVRGGYFNNLQGIVARMPVERGRSVLVTGDVRFGEFPVDALRGQTQYDVYLRPQLEFGGWSMSLAFLDSSVTLDYGSFSDRKVYFHAQRSDYVPFPSAAKGIPTSYLGLTNQQLWNRHHVAIGGSVVASSAKEAHGVFGLVIDKP